MIDHHHARPHNAIQSYHATQSHPLRHPTVLPPVTLTTTTGAPLSHSPPSHSTTTTSALGWDLKWTTKTSS